jgi:TRAP-type C4-dicarboxylate transport system permease small subunit
MTGDAQVDTQVDAQVPALFASLRKAQLRLAAAALVIMMSVTVADVTMRAIFNRPVRGAFDMVESMLLIFVFHGMSSSFLQRSNIVIDLIDTWLSERIVRVLIRLADTLTVVTLLVFAWAMLTPASQAYNYGDVKMELRLPIYVLWIVAYSGMAGSILCALGALLFKPARPSHGDGA